MKRKKRGRILLNGLAFITYLHLRGIQAQIFPFECRLALCLDKLISHTGEMLLKKRPHCDSFSGQDHNPLEQGPGPFSGSVKVGGNRRKKTLPTA